MEMRMCCWGMGGFLRADHWYVIPQFLEITALSSCARKGLKNLVLVSD